MAEFSDVEIDFIRRAATYLERPSFLIKMADLVGMPLEAGLRLLPKRATDAVDLAFKKAVEMAVVTIPASRRPALVLGNLEAKAWWTGYRHSASTAVTGGVGGMFGATALFLELPVTTCLMMRSIGSIAGQFGEDLREPAVRLACLSVFGFGGPSSVDDEMDCSYLTMRAWLAATVETAAKYVAQTPARQVTQAIANGTAPTLVKLIARIAPRFRVVASQKLMAQLLPAIGGFGGAFVNVTFCEHFNTVARYHFGIRHLERRYGRDLIQTAYQDAAYQLTIPRTRLYTPEVSASGA